MSLDTELATITAGIVSVIQGLTEAGNVFDHQPYAPQTDQFLANYQYTAGSWTHLRAWLVQHARTALAQADFDSLGVETSFRIVGFLSLSEAHDSEATMRALALSVALALRQESNFGSTAVLDTGTLELEGPVLAQVPNEGPGSVVCHRVEITLPLVLDQALVWS